MLGFEISSEDIQQAVKKALDIDLSLFDADRIMESLDLRMVSDKANYCDEDENSLDEATERAHKEIVRQVNEKSLIR